MFGFLKQKLADFSNKLKQTISKEETSKTNEETKTELKKEEINKPIKETKPKQVEKKETKKVVEEKKTVLIKETKKPEIKKIEKPKQEKKVNLIEDKKEEKPKELAEPKKELLLEEKPKAKGILSKIFGFGKKEQILKEKKEIKIEEKVEKVQKEEKQQQVKEKEVEIKEEPIKIEPIKETKPEVKKIIEETKPTVKEETEEIENSEEEIEDEVEEAEEELIKEEEKEESQRKEKPRNIHVLKVDEDKRELKAKIGVGSGLKGLIFGRVEISEKQIKDLLFELELSLIESDVEQDAATELVNQIKQRLVGKKVLAKNIDLYLQEQIKEILTEMMKTEKINVLDNAREAKRNGEPYKILILGPNGAGKTTSIAKLVNYFQKNKLTCILAAGDTFRAGAIDQIEIHAKNLGVRVIKHQYGADPAAIAFDAISAAKAGKIDVVIIDSAGRQETNKNLMEELKKLERVAKPDLKLFVGESYVGQGLLDQVDEFAKIIGIDGYILTKMDTDAKGGTAISLTYKTKKPIIFIGTGQGYEDFEEFTPEYILNRII